MPTVTILVGDARHRLTAVADQSIQCCVTSPPYFGLRDYGHAGQLGLEPTPEAYVAALVDVFREVKRVLTKDGTLWLNLGDSYNTSPAGLKPKNLLGIPWRVAFALQADGWYLRQDIIWHKPNPMPENVTDRCTKAHEYLFLLTTSARYYYDYEAVKEPASSAPGATWAARKSAGATRGNVAFAGKVGAGTQRGVHGAGVSHNLGAADGRRNRRSVWTVPIKPYTGAHFATFPPALIEPCILAGSRPGDTILDPFGGSGTTGMVAVQQGRDALLCELNPSYVPLMVQRMGTGATVVQDHGTL